MKPVAAISLVIIGILVTVVIEETRIKKLQQEILRLRALPGPSNDAGARVAPEPIPNPPAGPVTMNPETPMTGDGTETPPVDAPPVGTRKVPTDYPAPDETRSQSLALGPYADLHYRLNLTNRERAFFDDILMTLQIRLQQLAAKWIQSIPDDRPAVEAEIDAAKAASDQRMKNFLGSESDFNTFAEYREMQPARELLGQLNPIMDQKGVALLPEKEAQLITAIHEAHSSTNSIDWNSIEGMQAIAAGGAEDKFLEEWSARQAVLEKKLPEFLDEKEVEVVIASREELKQAQLGALADAIKAVRGTSE